LAKANALIELCLLALTDFNNDAGALEAVSCFAPFGTIVPIRALSDLNSIHAPPEGGAFAQVNLGGLALLVVVDKNLAMLAHGTLRVLRVGVRREEFPYSARNAAAFAFSRGGIGNLNDGVIVRQRQDIVIELVDGKVKVNRDRRLVDGGEWAGRD
jgi:hypothetical protein